MRTGARDALLLDATDKENKGFIFGFHRSMDSAGAVIGSTLALGILYFSHSIRHILQMAIIPAFLTLVIFFLVKDIKKRLVNNKISLSLSVKQFSADYKLFLLGIMIFSIGNSSDTFLILRAQNLGLTILMVISAYIVYNLVYSFTSAPAGKIADRIGAKNVFILGIATFILVYIGFALNTFPCTNMATLCCLWILYCPYRWHSQGNYWVFG